MASEEEVEALARFMHTAFNEFARLTELTLAVECGPFDELPALKRDAYRHVARAVLERTIVGRDADGR